jgi:predicted small lipoprotein YifL
MKAISNTRGNSREQLKLLLVALTVSFLAACGEEGNYVICPDGTG